MAEENSRFGKRTRYSIKESYAQDAKGIIHNSISELNPNVVRIEPLGPAARQAFLGPVHAAADALKLRIAYAMNPESFKPFYGILTPSDLRQFSISFASQWNEEDGKTSYKRATEILKSPAVAMPLGASVGETVGGEIGGYDAAGFGLGTAAGAIASFIMNNKTDSKGSTDNSLVGKVASVVGSIGEQLGSTTALYGFDSSSTGASTLKTFGGSKMALQTSLNFTWYMPEQEDLFRLSIHRLLQLAYVRSAYCDKKGFYDNLKSATNSAMQQSFVNAKAMKDALGGVGQSWIDAGDAVLETAESVAIAPAMKTVAENSNGQLSDGTVDVIENGVQVGSSIGKNITEGLNAVGGTIDQNAKEMGENGQFSNVDKQNVVNGMNTVISKVLEAYIEGSTFMGANFVLVPNPVRLTVGNILDVEPMVITNVKIIPSEELFINSIGASIPVTIKVTVDLVPWMTPGPNHDFIHFIGDNLFYPIPTKKEDGSK